MFLLTTLYLSSSFLTKLKNIYLVLHKTPFLWKDFPFNFSSLSRKSLKRTSFKKGLFCPLFFSITTSHVMDDPVIHIGIIMKGVGRGHTKAHDLKMQFVILYRSILKHAKRKNLHFILLTDPLSVPYLEPILHKFAHKDKCNSIEVSYDFVDTSHITQNYIKPISQMRPLFTSATLQAKKYRDDLFMMGPFYHRIFPYDKLIMLDADLKFRIDVAELYDHFDRFDEKQVMGVAVDLAPHYRVAFRKFRESNPDTFVGEPGKFQVS